MFVLYSYAYHNKIISCSIVKLKIISSFYKYMTNVTFCVVILKILTKDNLRSTQCAYYIKF